MQKRTQEILGSLFDLPISTGTVLKMVSRCAAKVSNVVEAIKEHMCNAAKAHFDETGTRVDGHTRWDMLPATNYLHTCFSATNVGTPG